MNNLLPGERIDDLQRNGYKIIQNPQKFCFGMDAVLLSGFIRVKPGEDCLDLGCGNGIIPAAFVGQNPGTAVCRAGDSSPTAQILPGGAWP